MRVLNIGVQIYITVQCVVYNYGAIQVDTRVGNVRQGNECCISIILHSFGYFLIFTFNLGLKAVFFIFSLHQKALFVRPSLGNSNHTSLHKSITCFNVHLS